MGYGLMIFALALPPVIVAFVEEHMSGTPAQGWRVVGIFFAVIIVVGMTVCVLCTKGKDSSVQQAENTEGVKKKNIFSSYLEVLKLRPVRFLAVTVIGWSMVAAIISGGAVYMLTNNFHVTAGQQSLYFTLIGLFSVFWALVINQLAKRVEKKKLYFAAMIFSGAALTVFGIMGVKSFEQAIALQFLFAFGNTTFYTVYFSLMYDLSEVDEYVNGQSRIGAMAGLMDLVQKVGTAISMQILGVFLQMGGYGVAGKEVQAADTIISANTWFPGIIGIATGLLAILYPVTKKRHTALKEALKLKKEGQPYSEEGFSKLLRR